MKNNAQKKHWSKKKKIIVAVCCALAFLLVAIVGAGLGALKWYCTPAEYTVESSSAFAPADTKIIAHRGFRAVAPENTAPAFEEAGKAGFWAAECDVYRTIDGVWVIQHDFITYRMMNMTKKVEKCTFDELNSHITDNGVNIDKYPNLKICTLDEYLKICQKYGMNAVIEFKEENNQEYYGEVIDLIKQYPEVEVTFISFQFSDLQTLRKLCDNDMMYLVQEVTDKDIELAKTLENCGIDFNGNKKENLENIEQIVNKLNENNMLVGVWTIDDPAVMKQYTDLGVKYITTDSITY